jgi:hypothetical protein
MSNFYSCYDFNGIVFGDRVEKISGDYKFAGVVVSCFIKKSAAPRIVVENDDGILHIFHPKQLKKTI